MLIKKSYHHGNLEEELIETGLRLLNEKGSEGFSLRKVAYGCGVSHSAPYKHFKDLEALLSAMQKYVADNFAKALRDSLELHKEDDDKMIYFAQSYLDFFIENPHYFYFFIKQDHDEIDLTNLKEVSKHRPFEIFRFTALEELKKFNVPEEAHSNILIKMWVMVHGFTMLAVMQNVKFQGDWRNLLKDILNMHSHKDINRESEGL